MLSRETHIPEATVWRIVYHEGLHPYYLQRVQAQEQGDYIIRMDFYAVVFARKCCILKFHNKYSLHG